MTDADRLSTLLASEPYWTAHALKTQGSRFHRALGDALDAGRIAFAFRTVLARQPRADEVAVLTGVLDKQRAKFAAGRAAAAKLLAVGESPRNEELDQVELAAWATVCSVILNLDEAVTRG